MPKTTEGSWSRANNVFPRGASSIHFSGVARSSVTGNRFHSFYPGMLIFADGCSENLVASNHFLRDCEPWAPMIRYDNGLDDLFGVLHIDGSGNSIMSNHVSFSVDRHHVTPAAAKPVIIRVAAGKDNTIANTHVVATTDSSDTTKAPNSACFSTQVGALLSTGDLLPLDVTTVLVEAASTAQHGP